MKNLLVRCSLFAFALTFFNLSHAQAQWGLGPAAYFSSGYANSLYTRDYVPYYAMHPPVYYSEPVPRTYGYSPFAYMAFQATPAPRIVHYGTVIHAHAPKPMVVENPYFNKSTAQTSFHSASTSRATGPQVIYPAEQFSGIRGR